MLGARRTCLGTRERERSVCMCFLFSHDLFVSLLFLLSEKLSIYGCLYVCISASLYVIFPCNFAYIDLSMDLLKQNASMYV